VSGVNDYYKNIPRVDLNFPDYDEDSENLYLRGVVEGSSRFALMDCKNIVHGYLGSKIEFCDLFGRGNELIHVKRFGGSSVLSHLFAQGSVSGELMLTDKDFRVKVREKLPASHRGQVSEDRPSPDKHPVIFAIISTSSGPLNLPFFSRLSLRHAASRLKGFGYQVSLAKIGVTENRKMLLKAGAKPRRNARRRLVDEVP
jgi:uncharacterized protein (TIGR04141 family)